MIDPWQGTLWPAPDPGPTPTSLRIASTAGISPAIRDLPTAALRALVAAERYGEAWLIAPDNTTAHVAPDGTVHPTTGWAAPAARTIHQRKAHQ